MNGFQYIITPKCRLENSIKMRILITGATGFIGVKLCLRLANQGHIIHALYRSESKIQQLKHDNIRLLKGDITNIRSLEFAMQSCDYVYHLASYTKLWVKNHDTYSKINYQGTLNVLNVANKLGIKKIVVTSTAGVFGPSTNNIVSEKSKKPTDFFTEYELTKAKAEDLVKDHVRKGQNVVIVNPTRVFGPGLLSASNSVTKIISLYIKGRFRIIPGNGKSIGNYVFIDDVVNGHILAMEKGEKGERYILGGINVSYIEFFKSLANVSGKKYSQFKLPVFLMLSISLLMFFLGRRFGIAPLITPCWVRKYCYNWELSCKKAIEKLRYEITPLEEGLRRTVCYLISINQNPS